MNELRRRFDVLVGYSDHTPGDILPISATARGSCLHEKHITLDRTLPGPDHKASIEPDELIRMVKNIRITETCLGILENKPTYSEIKNIPRLRKSVVAACDIPLGTVITNEMITAKRPATGLHPRNCAYFVGKRATQNIEEDTLMEFKMVE